MSGIVGVAYFDGHPLEPHLTAAMLDAIAHRGPDANGVWSDGPVGLGHNALWTTPESLRERLPLHSADKALVLVADGRLDNRDDLIRRLGPQARPVNEITDADLVLQAYERWGEACAVELVGDFVFAIWDSRRRRLFCARDVMGVRGLYYATMASAGTGLRIAFASEIKALWKATWVPRDLNEERIAEHLRPDFAKSAFEDKARTFFRHVQRLPPAHTLIADAQGIRLRQYWALDATPELRLASDEAYEEAFREQLTQAVQCRLRSAYPVGSFLSGGLDSSSITCIASKALTARGAGPLRTYSAIFPGLAESELRRLDEREYVDAVVQRYPVESRLIPVDGRDPLSDLDYFLWLFDEPTMPFNLYLHWDVYQAARGQEVRVLLDGIDGDTTVSHGLERLPALAKALQWSTLLREARAIARHSPASSLNAWRILKGYCLRPLLADLAEDVRHAFRRPLPRHDGTAARDTGDDQRRGGKDRRWAMLRSPRETHLRGLQEGVYSHGLELLDQTAAGAAVDARYPFFDRRLMELCLALPADQKLRDGRTRSILRRSMQGLLPPLVQWRNSKANLSGNFRLGMATHHAGSSIAAEESAQGGRLAEWVSWSEVGDLQRRLRAEPTNDDAQKLFSLLVFLRWSSTLP